MPLQDLKGNSVNLDISQNKESVFYFLSPECPLCQNYTLAFRQLYQKFKSQGVAFYGIFPGKWYSAGEIDTFRIKYELPFDMLIDTDMKLSHSIGATITPEAFLVNNQGETLYDGKIDNWVNALGKKKLEVTHNYLEDAITASLDGKEINPKKTEAIGCLIE